ASTEPSESANVAESKGLEPTDMAVETEPAPANEAASASVSLPHEPLVPGAGGVGGASGSSEMESEDELADSVFNRSVAAAAAAAAGDGEPSGAGDSDDELEEVDNDAVNSSQISSGFGFLPGSGQLPAAEVTSAVEPAVVAGGGADD